MPTPGGTGSGVFSGNCALRDDGNPVCICKVIDTDGPCRLSHPVQPRPPCQLCCTLRCRAWLYRCGMGMLMPTPLLPRAYWRVTLGLTRHDLAPTSANCTIARVPPTHPCLANSNGACNVGVCAYSDDYVSWHKTGCMTHAPNPSSETNHDTSIWRDGPNGTWYQAWRNSVELYWRRR